ncbi:MAG: hypothetical protein F9B45_24390 [Phycisphaera sp. RhM]|nr:hypothetical protein [Phycisphaera sp. RhM]
MSEACEVSESNGWQDLRWGDIATLEYGKSLKGYREKTSGVPVYGTNGPIGFNDEALCETAGVVIGRKGAYRGVHFSPDAFFVIDTAFYLKPKIEFDIKWAYYELLTKDINSMDSGSAIPSTSREDFYGLPVKVPPLPEQRAIASILGALDDKIELNRRMNATLESLARAIFKSWFVDFDPVKINAGQMPADSYDPTLLSLFPSTFQDSELGPLPEGWRIETLGDHVELQRGKTYKSKLKGTPGPYLLGLGTIERNGGFRAEKLVTYGGDNPQNLLLYPGDLYVSLKDVTQSADLLGSVARVPNSIEVGRLTQDTVKLVFNANAPSRSIVYRTLLTPAYREYCRSCATGTTNLGLAREDFLSYPLIVPPEEIENAFDDTMCQIEGQIDMNERESSSLARSRDLLLPKLLSGELQADQVREN